MVNMPHKNQETRYNVLHDTLIVTLVPALMKTTDLRVMTMPVLAILNAYVWKQMNSWLLTKIEKYVMHPDANDQMG